MNLHRCGLVVRNDKEEVMGRLEELVKEFLRLIGEDPSREGLKETPKRVACMWLEELVSGYWEDPSKYVKVFNVEEYVRYEDLVLVKDVPVRSICEHHLLPFFGKAHLAYIPTDKVLGFSKFSRILNVYSRRLQLQERLTQQVADFLFSTLRPKGLVLIIEAIHTCALVRGVEEPMVMTTVASRGLLREDKKLRSEVISLLMRGNSLADYVRFT